MGSSRGSGQNGLLTGGALMDDWEKKWVGSGWQCKRLTFFDRGEKLRTPHVCGHWNPSHQPVCCWCGAPRKAEVDRAEEEGPGEKLQ